MKLIVKQFSKENELVEFINSMKIPRTSILAINDVYDDSRVGNIRHYLYYYE